MPPWAHVPVGVGRVWAWRTSTGRGKAWGCQGAGPEGDRRVPAGGREAPEVFLQQPPHPRLGCSSWGGGACFHVLPSQTLQPTCTRHPPSPARGLWGPHCDRCPLLQVVRSYKATIQQTLDILFLREGSEFLSSTDASSRDSADRTIIAWDFQSSAKISNQIFHVRNPVIGPCFQVEPQPQVHPCGPQTVWGPRSHPAEVVQPAGALEGEGCLKSVGLREATCRSRPAQSASHGLPDRGDSLAGLSLALCPAQPGHGVRVWEAASFMSTGKWLSTPRKP